MHVAALLHNPIVRGVISGVVSAAAVDFHSFRSWKSFSEVAEYSWSTALFRWCTGGILGAFTGAGFGAFT